MIKAFVYAVALIVLLGVAFVLWSTSSPMESAELAAQADQLQMRMVDDSEEADSYSIRVEYPQFGNERIDAIVRSKVDAAIAAFKSYPSDTPSVDSVPKNELDISYDTVYAGEDFVSVELLISEYTGGAHPNTVVVGVNIDRKEGKEVSLDAVLALAGKTLTQIAGEADRQLRAKLEDAYFEDGAMAKAENYSTFLIDKDSVTFVFNVYQVAPYAAGPQEFEVARVRQE